MESEREGTLVMLACHCVYDPQTDAIYTDVPQFVNDRPVYEAHLDYAFRHIRLCRNWMPNSNPLLVISGGFTKVQRNCSESRSYIEMAQHMGLMIPRDLALEEFALTSIENLLFSLYVFHEVRGAFPARIDVISWAFKRERFEATLNAINGWAPLGERWESLDFFPVGDLRHEDMAAVQRIEQSYINSLASGLAAYYGNPQTEDAISRRDVYGSRPLAKKRYAKYPLPFPSTAYRK